MDRKNLQAVLRMYAQGYFPLGMGYGIGWFDQRAYGTPYRALMPLDERFHIPRSLRRVLNSKRFEVHINRDFAGVLRGCATRGGSYSSETWLTPEVAQLYLSLHQYGFAHSFEAWHQGRLAGGVLGVALGAAFIGDSMFYSVPDASKVALVRLVEHLRTRGFEIFDVQVQNPHLARFGAIEVDPLEFRQQLFQAIQKPARFVD
ncbi:MAG: leucyl/phenylalanyl-tRNA--protein transferase [Meiothermus sp.]|uniref:leucyl/phenylalanyl-tRNA--protein transferase n=1 Tax=Meiothermus sp. TaxID=1955249 RepID=UPI0028CDB935|nr:leucyl/phenylalanyl-tRNA--protein transferase [Meiothermus sp.]MDT7919283.1 leucyl/phenylalanyl-tRNA--protein transferase [Meiothermus sp.]